MAKWQERYTSILLIVPAIAYIIYFSFFPTIQAVYGSFQTRNAHFVLLNYQELITFGINSAIVNTVIVTICALALQLALGLVIALVLNREFKGRSAISAIILIPFGVATVVTGYIFSNIFSYSGGYANTILRSFGLSQMDWLQGYLPPLFSLIVADSWKNTPIIALILLAGMNSIPPEAYLAARIDGAGPIRTFAFVTLPNLVPSIGIALIIRGISEFNIFAMALLLFPHKLLTTLTYAFYDGGAGDTLAYASATVLLAFVLTFVGIVLYLQSRNRTRGG